MACILLVLLSALLLWKKQIRETSKYRNIRKILKLSKNYSTIIRIIHSDGIWQVIHQNGPVYSGIREMDISKNINLINLDCSFNNLSELDVRRNTKLIKLNCSSNNLTTLDISQNTKLTDLLCLYNKLSELNLRQNIELIRLDCSKRNSLSKLDVSQNIK